MMREQNHIPPNITQQIQITSNGCISKNTIRMDKRPMEPNKTSPPTITNKVEKNGGLGAI